MRGSAAVCAVVTGVLLVTTLGGPAGAQAPPPGDATDGDLLIVEAADGVTAEVEREPFALRVRDRSGRTVLSTLPEADDAPRVRLPLPDPLPTAPQVPDQPPVYAPLTFTVGVDRPLQFPASNFAANVLLGIQGGVEHAATDVVAVERDGTALELTLATTATDRTMRVRIAPDQGAAIKLTADLDDPGGVSTVGAAFASSPDEAFHGFGGRRNTTDHRGGRFYNWLEEFSQRPDAFAPITLLPTFDDVYQFPGGADAAYYVQTSFVSSNGYAAWLERDELSRFRLAADRDDAWHVAVAAPTLELVVAPGDGPTAVATMTAITGRNPVPPDWSLGPMVSRAVEPGVVSASAYAAAVAADLDEVERLDLPLTGFSIEGWPLLEEAGVLEEIIGRMRARDIRPVVYLKPFVGGSEGYERADNLATAVSNGWVATTPGGLPYLFGTPLGFAGIAALLDLTIPDAREWYAGRVREVLDLGAEGFMQDFGEQVFVDMRFADGSTGAQMHNRYPVDYHRLTREVFDDYVAEHPEREPWFFVRSGYTGRPGSAASESASWGGDNTTDWSRASGIGSVVPDMLNRGLGGAYGYATDIGGYFDLFSPPDEELVLRWAQLASLIPVNRLHGSPINGTHVPWSFGDAFVEDYRVTIERHLDAQPLIRALWREAAETGAPIARPLWWHHPDDDRARAEDQQWLLGPDVLVAPVVEPGATTRTLWLPEGCWQHVETGREHTGPDEITVDAPLTSLPWFVRCGTDPLGDAARADGSTDGATGTDGTDDGASEAAGPELRPDTPASPGDGAAPVTGRTVSTTRPLPVTGGAAIWLGALLLTVAAAVRRTSHRA